MYFSISLTLLYRNYYLQSFIRPESKKKNPLSHNKLYKKNCYWKSDYRQKIVHDLSFGGWVILMLEARQYRA